MSGGAEKQEKKDSTYSEVSAETDKKAQMQEYSFEDNATLFSTWFMTYLDPLFDKGFKQGLELEDLGPVSKQDETYGIYVR